MKRGTLEQAIVLLGLILFTVGLRLYFQYIPNFAPVAAVSLFAGYFFRSRVWALLVPIVAMAICDHQIGGYQPLLMIAVYGCLTIPVWLRGYVRDAFRLEGETRQASWAVAGLLGCTLASSVLFFIVTNGMTWVVTPWYPRSWDGLVHCYASALPFFRYTLAGDLIFGFALFGSYAAVKLWRERAMVVRLSESHA